MFGVFRLPSLPCRERIILMFIRKRAVTAQPEGIRQAGPSPNVPLIHTMSSPLWQVTLMLCPWILTLATFLRSWGTSFSGAKIQIIFHILAHFIFVSLKMWRDYALDTLIRLAFNQVWASRHNTSFPFFAIASHTLLQNCRGSNSLIFSP